MTESPATDDAAGVRISGLAGFSMSLKELIVGGQTTARGTRMEQHVKYYGTTRRGRVQQLFRSGEARGASKPASAYTSRARSLSRPSPATLISTCVRASWRTICACLDSFGTPVKGLKSKKKKPRSMPQAKRVPERPNSLPSEDSPSEKHKHAHTRHQQQNKATRSIHTPTPKDLLNK